ATLDPAALSCGTQAGTGLSENHSLYPLGLSFTADGSCFGSRPFGTKGCTLECLDSGDSYWQCLLTHASRCPMASCRFHDDAGCPQLVLWHSLSGIQLSSLMETL